MLGLVAGLLETIRRRGSGAVGRGAGPTPVSGLDVRLADGLIAPHRPLLEEIESRLASLEPAEAWKLFAPLDDDLWALLLTTRFTGFPRIRELLPDLPPDDLQAVWNGTSGTLLAAQGAAFYQRLKKRHEQFGPSPLESSTIIDFGCGWGRLTRLFGRDASHGKIWGCDPVQGILDECVRSRVPGNFVNTSQLPEAPPFDGGFDLAYAFSVFTHLSEAACEAAVETIHRLLRPGGLLVATVRPRAYARECEALRGPERAGRGTGELIFVPHAADPNHFQYRAEMDYGETIIPIEYVRKAWGSRLELLATDLLLADPYQLMLTFRKPRGPAG